jgi:hypothetical protein
VIAARHAAGDLQIDDPVADAVSRDDLVEDDVQRARHYR